MLRRRLARLLLLVALAAALVGGARPAEARKAHHSRARHRLHKPPNMPPGWVWPPSHEMRVEGARCLEHLTALGVKWKKASATRKVVTPIVVPDMTFGSLRLAQRFNEPGPFVIDCQFAEDLVVHAEPALKELGVVEIRFATLHRFDYLPHTRILSRHATGLGADVVSFVTTDGVEHQVERDYKSDPLLQQIETAIRDSGGFRRPLTPGNDPRHHYNHFHLEGRTAVERTDRAKPTT